MASSVGPPQRRTLTIYLVAAGAVLALAGLGHAALQQRIDAVLAKTTEPAESLNTIALTLGDWAGREIPIDDEILEIASFDDFWINRLYESTKQDEQASVFVGYVGRPRAHIGHRPDVCFAAQGWTQIDEQRLTIGTADQKPIEAVLYTFQEPHGRSGRLRVLSTYLVNGQFTNDAARFTGWNQRRIDIFGVRQPAYLARVQVSMISRPDESELPLLEDLATRISVEVLQRMPILDQEPVQPSEADAPA